MQYKFIFVYNYAMGYAMIAMQWGVRQSVGNAIERAEVRAVQSD